MNPLWRIFFGGLKRFDQTFTDANFQIPQYDDVEEYKLDRPMTGDQVLLELRDVHRAWANLQDQGFYITAYPDAQKSNELVGVYQDGEEATFLLYGCNNGERDVRVCPMTTKFRAGCKILVYKEKDV